MKSLFKLDTVFLLILIGIGIYLTFYKTSWLQGLLGFGAKASSKQSVQFEAKPKPKETSNKSSAGSKPISIETAKQKMQQSKCVIALFADWCGHCKEMKPKYSEVAATMPNVYWVDQTDDSSFAEELGVEGFPSVLLSTPGKKPEFYKKSREVDAMEKHFNKFLNE